MNRPQVEIGTKLRNGSTHLSVINLPFVPFTTNYGVCVSKWDSALQLKIYDVNIVARIDVKRHFDFATQGIFYRDL